MVMQEAEIIKNEVANGQLIIVHTCEAPLSQVIESAPGDRLGLLSLPYRLRVFDSPSSLIFSVEFPGAEFSKDRFVDLLNQARRRESPATIPSSRLHVSGTLDDWRMPDNVTGSSSENQRLKGEHMTGLSKPFAEFDANDRRSYLYAAAPLSAMESENFIRGQANRLLTMYMDEARMHAVEQILVGSSIDISSVRFSNDKLSLKDAAFLFDELPDQLRRIIAEASKKADLGDRIVVDPAMPATALYRGWSPHPHLHPCIISHLGRGIVEIEYAKSSGRFSLKGESPRALRFNIARQSDYNLIPWQVWARSKDSGERIWLDSSLPNELTGGVDQGANIRYGFILATVLSLERDMLPDKLPLNPHAYGGQAIREAQMPVLVYLREVDIRRLVGENKDYQIMDPHLTILNGSYFRAIERSVHLN